MSIVYKEKNICNVILVNSYFQRYTGKLLQWNDRNQEIRSQQT